MLAFITFYVRYRQVAEYLPSSQTPHHVRVNKAAFGVGIVAVFGITLVANFPVCETLSIEHSRLVGRIFSCVCEFVCLSVRAIKGKRLFKVGRHRQYMC